MRVTKTIVVKVVLTKLLLESLPAALIATAAALTDAFAETAKTTTAAASSEEVFHADRPFSPHFATILSVKIEGYHRP